MRCAATAICILALGCAGRASPAPTPVPSVTPSASTDVAPRPGSPLKKLPKGAYVLEVEVELERRNDSVRGRFALVDHAISLTPERAIKQIQAQTARGPSSARVQVVADSGLTDFYFDVARMDAEDEPMEEVRVLPADFTQGVGLVAVIASRGARELRLVVGDTVVATAPVPGPK